MKLFYTFIFGVFLSACSALPPQTEVIHEALTTNMALRSATIQCVGLGGGLQQQVKNRYSAWWQHNRQYVQAADYGLLKLNWDSSQPAVEDQRAVLSMQMLELLKRDSDALVKDWVGAPATGEDCEKLFTKVSEGDFDLDSRRSSARLLNALSIERTTLESDADTARSINARYRKYGRSLYIVEQTLQDAGCSQPTISLLRNSWPIEVYDAVCGESDYMLVKCLWGRCEVKR